MGVRSTTSSPPVKMEGRVQRLYGEMKKAGEGVEDVDGRKSAGA